MSSPFLCHHKALHGRGRSYSGTRLFRRDRAIAVSDMDVTVQLDLSQFVETENRPRCRSGRPRRRFRVRKSCLAERYWEQRKLQVDSRLRRPQLRFRRFTASNLTCNPAFLLGTKRATMCEAAGLHARSRSDFSVLGGMPIAIRSVALSVLAPKEQNTASSLLLKSRKNIAFGSSISAFNLPTSPFFTLLAARLRLSCDMICLVG